MDDRAIAAQSCRWGAFLGFEALNSSACTDVLGADNPWAVAEPQGQQSGVTGGGRPGTGMTAFGAGSLGNRLPLASGSACCSADSVHWSAAQPVRTAQLE
ncbi:hypothetical protein NM208_g12708 [Fusarium decemcellulare]|uniref:Uncharacterized protein n=1 Tax=Fusarium decemcellulare TaxID=57161 RepID=A0ACC1RN69_9HYPO|nr:hypothetical protein NM208_g12708 [Fusarium decemcellulare]